MLDIKVENSKWGDIQLVCPCSHESKKAFDMKLENGLVNFYCTNPECTNFFPSEIQLKILADIEKWIEKKGSIEGFTTSFNRTIMIPKEKRLQFSFYTKEKCKITAKYLRTETVGNIEPIKYYIIEVSNETMMNNSYWLENKKSREKEGDKEE